MTDLHTLLRESTGPLPKWSYSLAEACVWLHTECTGASCDLGPDERRRLRDTIQERIDNWAAASFHWHFDEAMRDLCRAAVAEYDAKHPQPIARNCPGCNWCGFAG